MLTVILVPLGLIGLIFSLLYLYLSWNFYYWKRKGINGPKPKFLTGTFPNLFNGKRHLVYDVDDIYREYKGRESFVGTFMTHEPQLLLIDPKLIKQVLISNFKAFHDNESSKWVNPNVEEMTPLNPFFITGDPWKDKRAQLKAALSMGKLKAAYPIMQESCKKLTKYVQDIIKAKGSELEAREFCLRFTGEFVADFLWGIDAGAFQHQNKKCLIVEMASKMMRHSFDNASFYNWTILLPILRKMRSYRLFPQTTDKFFFKIQKDAVALRMKTGSTRSDMLNYWIQQPENKALSVTEMTAHSLTLIMDGYETVGLVLSHCLLYLSRNIAAQTKLRQEILNNIEENGFLNFDSLTTLPYLDQCVYETLRLLPAVPLFHRLCTETCDLTGSNGKKVRITPGHCVQVPMYSIHHDPVYYPDAEEFMPERFDEENGGVKKFKELGVLMPFGDGPRICLGMKLGLVTAKVGLVELVKNFKFTVSDRTPKGNLGDPSTAFLFTFEGGIYINFEAI